MKNGIFSHGMVPWIFWGEKSLHGKALIFNGLRKNRKKCENNSCKPASFCHVSPVASERRNQQTNQPTNQSIPMSFTSMHNDYLDPDKHLYWGEEPEIPQLTPQQKAQVTKLRREILQLKFLLYTQPRTPITQESLFEYCPEGDFSYDGEPEDVGNAQLGESGWHESIQVIEQGRQDGKTWFVVLVDSVAGCGDYQPVGGWDEREGDEVTQTILDDLWFDLEGRSIEHFARWAEYCLNVAVTGDDPLDNWRYGKPCTPDSAIKAARDNVRYLRQMLKK